MNVYKIQENSIESGTYEGNVSMLKSRNIKNRT